MMPTIPASIPRLPSGAAAPAPRTASRSRSVTLSRAGYVFIAVFLTVVFEGAIRKWVSSAATLPLLLLRDVLALYLIVYAWRSGSLQRYAKVASVMTIWSCCVVAWSLMQIVAGESSPVVLLIGLRFWLLYTWFAVAAAATLNEADYRVAIRIAAVSMLVMAPLAVLQHYSPQGATINRQLDGDEESVFVVVAGVVRTTGTFSFTSGYANFILLVAPLVLGLLGARKHRRAQWIFAFAVFGAFLAGSVVSGSRTGVLTSGGLVAAYIGGRVWLSKGRDKPAALVAALMVALLVGVAAFFFSDAVTVTQQRFETAAEGEHFGGRLLTVFFGEPTVLSAFSWLGQGLGAGSNLATALSPGASNFALAESEAGRILLEGGLLGFGFVALKFAVLAIGWVHSWRLARRSHSPFPILMWLALLLALMTWQAIGQLSANGLQGLVLAYFLLTFRHPSAELFTTRRR